MHENEKRYYISKGYREVESIKDAVCEGDIRDLYVKFYSNEPSTLLAKIDKDKAHVSYKKYNDSWTERIVFAELADRKGNGGNKEGNYFLDIPLLLIKDVMVKDVMVRENIYMANVIFNLADEGGYTYMMTYMMSCQKKPHEKTCTENNRESVGRYMHRDFVFS